VILRILNLIVVGVLILAAAYVYRIKFDSTVQAERLAKIRGEVRRERDTIATLRAQWGELDNPARIEALAKRFLPLKRIEPTQFSSLDQLPERVPELVPPDSRDPIGAFLQDSDESSTTTGSLPVDAEKPSSGPHTNAAAGGSAGSGR
jgi:hypothetical protein